MSTHVATSQIERVPLVLVAGFAGSGKSEAGKLLSLATGWSLLDKDTLTRPLTESLLTALGGDPDDRHSPLYGERVRPLEYDCLMKTCWENVEHGVPVIAVAPFLKEVADAQWLARLLRRCDRTGAGAEVLWVDSDESSMQERLTARNARRDTWKLANWREYLTTISLDQRPVRDHLLIDNRMTAATPLAEQVESAAHELASRFGTVTA
ncbi:ATP-binding protein [Streptomyces venezuelae]|uniref:AAA family ATPase n=1 Tax=Streptomyces venezuelae TaxID=54571 RepID=UPI0012386C6F|nr:AAA family ATPase [Streptomyces venezuelae]QES08559.1 ATP-binding protein [Streptomyces venezuelae]